MTLTPIEGLIAQKFGRLTEKYRSLSNGEKLMLEKLKKVLCNEIDIFLRLNGMTKPPFDPFKIRKVGKVTVRVEYSEGIGAHGTLEVVGDEFIVRLEKSLLKNANYRLRSTMAHELMHTWFYDTSEVPPKKLGFGSPSRRHLLMQEELCYFLARQFLMPTFSIKGEIIKSRSFSSPSINGMRRFKAKYNVSSEVIAYRMIADLGVWKAIFIKSVKEGDKFKAITRLKAKSEKIYENLKVPRIIPSSNPSEWEKTLFDHISKTLEKNNSKDTIVAYGKKIVLESARDSKSPASVITLIYESRESMFNLRNFF